MGSCKVNRFALARAYKKKPDFPILCITGCVESILTQDRTKFKIGGNSKAFSGARLLNEIKKDRRQSMNTETANIDGIGRTRSPTTHTRTAGLMKQQQKTRRMKILILDDSNAWGAYCRSSSLPWDMRRIPSPMKSLQWEHLAADSYDSVVCDLVLEADQSGIACWRKSGPHILTSGAS